MTEMMAEEKRGDQTVQTDQHGQQGSSDDQDAETRTQKPPGPQFFQKIDTEPRSPSRTSTPPEQIASLATFTSDNPDAPPFARESTRQTITGDQRHAREVCYRCGVRIGPNERLCDSCARSADEDGRVWLPDRPVVILISTDSVETARTQAGVAADYAKDRSGGDPSYESIELVEELDDAPTELFRPAWRGHTTTTTPTTDDGKQLLESITRRMKWDEELSPEEQRTIQNKAGRSVRPHVFDKFGTPITSLSEFRTRVNDDITHLVPALAFRKALRLSGKTRSLSCRYCCEVTTHLYADRVPEPREHLSGQRIWKCRFCESFRTRA